MKIYTLIGIITIFATSIVNESIAQETIKVGTWEGQKIRYRAGKIGIKLKKNVSPGRLTSLLNQFDAEVERPFGKLRWGVIALPKGNDILSIIEKVKAHPVTATAEPVVILDVAAEPDDPYFQGTSPATYNHQWGLKNTGQQSPGGTEDADIDAELAWDLTTGSSNVVIAVLDSGIPLQDENGDGVYDEKDLSHPDLDNSDKIILGSDYAHDDFKDDGVKDRYGHGTHVSGIAAAETNNGEGVAGVCWECRLLVIQVVDFQGVSDGTLFKEGVTEAVDYAKNNDVELVINGSIAGDSSGVLEDAVEYANSNGVPIAVAVGNDTSSVGYPAAFSDRYENVVAVAATDHKDKQTGYSNQGPEVNVAAPGGEGDPDNVTVDNKDIFSTTPQYDANMDGISQKYSYLLGDLNVHSDGCRYNWVDAFPRTVSFPV